MPVMIKESILHILDTSNSVPVLSETLLSNSEDVTLFVSEIVKKTFYSDDIKNCTFQEDADVWMQCHNVSWELTCISQCFANHMFTIMRRNANIPMADVLMGVAAIDAIDYFFMIKLDYKSGLTHTASIGNEKKSVNIIRYKTLLPTLNFKVSEGFFVNMQTPLVKVVERKFDVDGVKDFYISPQILSCSESKTPRQKTTQLLKVAEKVSELYYAKEDDMSNHISLTMFDELQQEQPLRIEQLGKKFFSNNPAAQKEFIVRLEASDVSINETLSLSEQFQKKFQKQAIKTSTGVEIKIPSQLYSNTDAIEFLNNPDGTVSVLIKNIQI